MSDHLGWAPAASTHRARDGGSLGTAVAKKTVKEHVAPKGHMRICAKCRKNKLAALNPGPCQPCRSKHRRRIDPKKNWCLVVPKDTPLPVPKNNA